MAMPNASMSGADAPKPSKPRVTLRSLLDARRAEGRRMSVEEAVRKPLRMAGYADEREQASLANEMRRDLGDRPGDLALAQMALWTVWRNRRSHDGSLLPAYADVGRVSGALAQEAGERIAAGPQRSRARPGTGRSRYGRTACSKLRAIFTKNLASGSCAASGARAGASRSSASTGNWRCERGF